MYVSILFQIFISSEWNETTATSAILSQHHLFWLQVLYTVSTQANCFQTLQKAFEFIIQTQYGLNSAEAGEGLELVFIW